MRSFAALVSGIALTLPIRNINVKVQQIMNSELGRFIGILVLHGAFGHAKHHCA